MDVVSIWEIPAALGNIFYNIFFDFNLKIFFIFWVSIQNLHGGWGMNLE